MLCGFGRRLHKICCPACLSQMEALIPPEYFMTFDATALNAPSGRTRAFGDVPVPKLLHKYGGSKSLSFSCTRAVYPVLYRLPENIDSEMFWQHFCKRKKTDVPAAPTVPSNILEDWQHKVGLSQKWNVRPVQNNNQLSLRKKMRFS